MLNSQWLLCAYFTKINSIWFFVKIRCCSKIESRKPMWCDTVDKYIPIESTTKNSLK